MITEFKGVYSWLSNFVPVKVVLDGVEYKSTEHAYQSGKSDDPNWKKFCQTTESAGTIKKESKKIKLKNNWKDINLKLMEDLIDQKFNQEPFRTYLINTQDQMIQEGNYWNDNFWGICLKTNSGENRLGIMIMNKRKNLINEILPEIQF